MFFKVLLTVVYCLVLGRSAIMAPVTPTMPWRLKAKLYARATAFALPTALLVVAEMRDMYYRSTWSVRPIPPSAYHTGDVVIVANRWYTLPCFGQMLRSLLTKSVLKCTWDDVGVIVVRDGTPHILMADYDGMIDMPLDAFIDSRKPRGLAWRKIRVEHGFHEPSRAISELLAGEVKKMPLSPWYVFRASWRDHAEHTYYQYLVEFNKLKAQYRAASQRSLAPGSPGHASAAGRPLAVGTSARPLSSATPLATQKSALAIQAMGQRLQEMEIMREHLVKQVDTSAYTDFRLHSGSLVASFLATFDLLDKQLPVVSRYVPQDFAHDVPLKGASLDPPVVVFRD